MNERSIRRANWIGCGLACLWLLFVASTISPVVDDFEQYWQAAINLRDIGDPYATTPEPGQIPDNATTQHIAFPNPPFLAYLMFPFTFVSAATGLQIWYWLNVLFLSGFVGLCIRLSQSILARRWWGWVLLLAALTPPGRLSLQLGQVSVLLAFLAVSLYWFGEHARAAHAGGGQ
jgi:hypothetical protein